MQNLSSAAKQQRIIADDVEERYAEENGLEPTDMVALDHTYEDTGDDTDEVIDLGVLVGRMRLTDRIGGFSRPRISEEVCSFWKKKRDAKSNWSRDLDEYRSQRGWQTDPQAHPRCLACPACRLCLQCHQCRQCNRRKQILTSPWAHQIHHGPTTSVPAPTTSPPRAAS